MAINKKMEKIAIKFQGKYAIIVFFSFYLKLISTSLKYLSSHFMTQLFLLMHIYFSFTNYINQLTAIIPLRSFQKYL